MWLRAYQHKESIRSFIQYGLPLAMLLGLVILAQKVSFTDLPKEFMLGLTIDVLITVPVVHYLLIRKTGKSKLTVFTFFVLGLVLASIFIPVEGQFYLNHFKHWVLPLVELTVLTVVIRKVRILSREFKTSKGDLDFYSALSRATKEVLPEPLPRFFTSEISMFYYGFFAWKKKATLENEFSYHRKTGTGSILGVFVFLIGLETFPFHLLISRWNEVVAWVITIISIYTALQLLGILRSIARRRIRLGENELHLNYGIMADVSIPYAAIVSVEEQNKGLKFDKEIRQLCPFGELEKYNLVIKVSETMTIKGMYGLNKSFTTLALFVDEKEKFVNELTRSSTNLHG